MIAARRVAVRNDLAALSDEAVDVSRRLANVGAADRTDLLASEIEAEQARLAVDDARNAERRIWQHLVQVIGDPMLGPQPLAGDPDENLPTLNADLALATLLRESPELAAAEAGVERARAELVRSRKEQNPDLVVRAGPRYNRELLDPGPKPVGWEFFADVGVSVPLWNRNEAGIAAAEAELGRATAELTRVELVLRSRLAEVFEQYATATARVRAYREDIVPRARRVASSVPRSVSGHGRRLSAGAGRAADAVSGHRGISRGACDQLARRGLDRGAATGRRPRDSGDRR